MHRATYELFLAALAMLSLAQQAQAQNDKPDCHVLSVGIDNYMKGPLKGCCNDARNIAGNFQDQDGRMFGKVNATILLDEQATKQGIDRGLERIRGAGKAGDYIVVFLSGHGGRTNNNTAWYFVPQDSGSDGQVTDRQLLTLADSLAGQGKKVFVIIDACFAGQLRVNAKSVLNKAHPDGGGVVLMVSSMPGQVSAALGQFSAFAQAVSEGLAGYADTDRDGYITLREVRRFAYHRVYDLVKKGNQDGEIDYSLSISENLKLAQANGKPTNVTRRPDTTPARPNNDTPAPNAAAGLTNTEWTGRENLQGFGDLTFRFQDNHRAVMIDTAGTTNGQWRREGNNVVLTFNNGQTVYAGVLQGESIKGFARGGRGNTWGWTVNLQTQVAERD